MAIKKTKTGTAPPQEPRPRRRDDLALQELDGEALLYDPKSGAVHCFNPTILFVWDCCDGSRTIEKIVRVVAREFAIEREGARAIVEQVVGQLRKKDLLCADAGSDGKRTSKDTRDKEVEHPSARVPAREEETKENVESTEDQTPATAQGISRR